MAAPVRRFNPFLAALALLSGLQPPPRVRLSRSIYRPHQSVRERTRRIGGEAWAKFKATDRANRGLPPKAVR